MRRESLKTETEKMKRRQRNQSFGCRLGLVFVYSVSQTESPVSLTGFAQGLPVPTVKFVPCKPQSLLRSRAHNRVRVMFPFLPAVMVPRWSRLGCDSGRTVHWSESFSVAVRLCHHTNSYRQKRCRERSRQFFVCRVHRLPSLSVPLPPLIRANFPGTSAVISKT